MDHQYSGCVGLQFMVYLPSLPSLTYRPNDLPHSHLPAVLQAYLAGLTFALAASPCSTPVLATLLAYVASKGDVLQGGALLLSYTSGWVRAPVAGRGSLSLASMSVFLLCSHPDATSLLHLRVAGTLLTE